MSDLVGNSEDRFSHDASHIIQATVLQANNLVLCPAKTQKCVCGGGGLITSVGKVRADFLLIFRLLFCVFFV